MNCISNNCQKTVEHFIISKGNAINPQDCNIGDLRKLFGYFQYKSPNTSSYQCESLDKQYHEDLFTEMMKSWKKDSYKIISSNATFDKESPELALFGSSICSYCKRLLLKRDKTKNGVRETDLICLLRHLRNSLAHGRVFVIHGGNSIKILFEDFDTRNKVISARIICNQSDLRKWHLLINYYIIRQ